MLEREDHFFQLLCSENIHLGTENEKPGNMNKNLWCSAPNCYNSILGKKSLLACLPSIITAPERLECYICKQGVALNWYLDKVHCADHKPSRVHLCLRLCSVPAFGKCLIWLQYLSPIPPWFKLCFFSFPLLCWIEQLKQSFALHAGLSAEWEGCFFP